MQLGVFPETVTIIQSVGNTFLKKKLVRTW